MLQYVTKKKILKTFWKVKIIKSFNRIRVIDLQIYS